MSYGLNVEMHKQVSLAYIKKKGTAFSCWCGGVVIVTPSRVRCDLHAQKEEVDPCRVSLAGGCCIDFSLPSTLPTPPTPLLLSSPLLSP